MRNYYYTFGFDHILHHRYIKITAANSIAARERMAESFGAKWAFEYDEDKFLPQIEKYGLSEAGSCVVEWDNPTKYDSAPDYSSSNYAIPGGTHD
jgi:hypothetical protein